MLGRLWAVSLLLENPREERKKLSKYKIRSARRGRAAKTRVARAPEGERKETRLSNILLVFSADFSSKRETAHRLPNSARSLDVKSFLGLTQPPLPQHFVRFTGTNSYTWVERGKKQKFLSQRGSVKEISLYFQFW